MPGAGVGTLGQDSGGYRLERDHQPYRLAADAAAAAGEPDIVEKLKQGHQAGDKHFKVHIDGYSFLPYLMGEEEKGLARPHLLLG